MLEDENVQHMCLGIDPKAEFIPMIVGRSWETLLTNLLRNLKFCVLLMCESSLDGQKHCAGMSFYFARRGSLE